MTMNKETKVCQNCRGSFVIEPDDFTFYAKMQVPAPTWCPQCRLLRRLQFRNETTLYTRTCALCKKSVVSMYNPKSPYTIYCESCYNSDQWDAYTYGVPYDPARPFMDQLGELFRAVPKMTLFADQRRPSVRSEYVNYAGLHKDCYLLFNATDCENSMYSRGLRYSRETLDVYFGQGLERCYECVNAVKSTGVHFAKNATACIDSMFIENASGLQNCFGCVNLRNKSYYFFNEPLEKEEWERRVGEIRGSYAKLVAAAKRFDAFALQFPHRENSNIKAVDCVGDYLFQSKGMKNCFEATDSENCTEAFSVIKVKDSQDITGFGIDSELLYECVGVGGGSQRVIGSYWVESSRDVQLSYCVSGSSECFGCAGLKHGQYAILNVRYPKEEYERLRTAIIAELTASGAYGSFLPPALSPYAYNETLAQDNFPRSKEEVEALGFRWEDDIQLTKGKETLKPEEVPDNITDVPDSIVNEVLSCVSCDRNYRITPAELGFYRREVLPLPRSCFNCRHRARVAKRGPLTVFDRTCAHCGKNIRTTYAPNRKEVVYCEECYQAEVV
jgi:hypothetical protein